MANLTEQFRSRRVPFLPWRTSWGVIVLVGVVWGLAAAWSGNFSGWTRWQFVQALQVTLTLIALCCIPGLALVQLFWNEDRLAWPERLAVAWGIGMGMPALLLILFHLLHLPWPGWMTWVYLGAAALALAWVQVRRSGPAEHTPLAPSRLFAYVMLVGLAGLALLARLFSVHDLVVGPNVDSYQHSLIATLLVERQGLFNDWAPYAPLVTFTYHYAFHALVAWAFHLSGVPIVLLVPLVGQVMNAAMVPMLFALTSMLTRRPIAGVWAALLVGFVNLQPGFYVFWGRGPFVASHSLLVALLMCWMAAIEAPRMRPGLLALAAIGSAALAHAHYQTTILAAIFLFSYLVLLALRAPNVRAARA
ncbi:MAG TPA: hypothetical protein VFT99_11805, partial [Roseiflexaceae bacterium]|nr:hypothetical protein [Roseiflexaceae bacterium]